MREEPVEGEREKLTKPKISADLLRILYKNLLISVPASFICSVVVYFTLPDYAQNQSLLLWVLCMTLVSIFRLVTYYTYMRRTIENKYDIAYFLTGVTLTAVLWGMLGSLLIPADSITSQLIIILIITGITAGGAQTLAANLYATIINLFVIVLPLCVWAFSQSNSTYTLLGIAIFTYLIFMTAASVRNHRLLINAIELQYENLNLVSNLTDSNDKLFRSYKMLEKHENELSQINKLNYMLQSCKEVKESYYIISHIAKDLFSGYSGSLAIHNHESDEWETISEWGEGCSLKRNFKFHDCWGLRNGEEYHVNDTTNEMSCSHFDKNPASYICLPLLDPFGIGGILILCSSEKNAFTSYIIQLAMSFCEVIQLSLINLSLRESLYEQSIHDSLTGLYNRRYLDTCIITQLESSIQSNKSFCVAMLDLDHFKKLNDDLGHEAGDEFLKFMGKMLGTHFRKNDVALRYGGEEFLIVIADATLDDAYKRFQRISQEVKSSVIYYNGRQLPPMTVSIGIAEAPLQGKTVKDILQSADAALYFAKESGRDKVIRYHSDMHHTQP